MLKFKSKQLFGLAIIFSIVFWIVLGLGLSYHTSQADDSLKISVLFIDIYNRPASVIFDSGSNKVTGAGNNSIDIGVDPQKVRYLDAWQDSWGWPLPYTIYTHWYGSSIIRAVFFSIINILFYFIIFYTTFLVIDKIIYKFRK